MRLSRRWGTRGCGDPRPGPPAHSSTKEAARDGSMPTIMSRTRSETAKATYSLRNNLRRSTPLRYRDEATSALRTFVFHALIRYIPREWERLNFVFVSAEQLPPIPGAHDEQRIARLLSEAEWFLIFDILEHLDQELRDNRLGARDTPKAQEFRHLLNAFFEKEGYGHKVDEQGRIQHRGDEAFESAISNADIALAAAGSTTAREEIHKALEDLAKRPNPDLTGAIQHSMAGLECVANQAAGSNGIELGKLAKSRTDLFTPPLNDVIPKLYGFASNNGRHLTEGQDPEFAEAELTVGIAATVATYLARKMQI